MRNLFSTVLALSILATSAAAEGVITAGYPDATPACPAKEMLAKLTFAIAEADGATILDLTLDKGCLGIWDGSVGRVAEVDTVEGVTLVEFSKLARFPEGRKGTYWIASSALQIFDAQ